MRKKIKTLLTDAETKETVTVAREEFLTLDGGVSLSWLFTSTRHKRPYAIGATYKDITCTCTYNTDRTEFFENVRERCENRGITDSEFFIDAFRKAKLI